MTELHAAEPDVPPSPVAAISGGPWVKLDAYFRDPKNRVAPDISSETEVSRAFPLPSLGHAEIFTTPQDLTPEAAHSVKFSLMPPMFERRRFVPEEQKPKPDKPATAEASPSALPAVKPAQKASCDTPSEADKQRAKAMAADKETLNALRQAVQDLRLEKDLNFLMPGNNAGQQSRPAAP